MDFVVEMHTLFFFKQLEIDLATNFYSKKVQSTVVSCDNWDTIFLLLSSTLGTW